MSHAERVGRQICRKNSSRRLHRTAPGLVECLAIATPLLLIVALVIESVGFPNFTPGIDLSQTIIISGAVAVSVIGVVLAERGIGRIRPALGRYRGAFARAAFGSLLAVAGMAMMIHRIVAGS